MLLALCKRSVTGHPALTGAAAAARARIPLNAHCGRMQFSENALPCLQVLLVLLLHAMP